MVLNQIRQLARSQGQAAPQIPIIVSESESEAESVQAAENTRRGRSRARRAGNRCRPRPLSHIESRHEKVKTGYRLSRRVANARDIANLFPIPESELSVNDICPETSTLFGHLLNDASSASKWDEFTSCSERDQQNMLSAVAQSKNAETTAPPATRHGPLDSKACFLRIRRRIRIVYKRNKQHITSLLAELEELVRHLFLVSGDAVVILNLESGFHRCLAHGLAQYLGLEASSTGTDQDKALMLSTCQPCIFFPEKLLADLL